MSEATTTLKLLTGNYFDSYKRKFVKEETVITVCQERGIILEVCPLSSEEFASILEKQAKVIDLRGHTLLPGFVDAHVHLFLHPYSEIPWEDQLTKESIIERTIRAVTHAKKTLFAGFTTVRDLGTEGAGDADISLRRCLSGPNPIVPGPRYFCANRALVSTGSYGPKGVHHLNMEGVEGVIGAEVVNGKDECRKAVRRQIGAGADWIKIYADYRVRSRMLDVAPIMAARSIATFGLDEIQEIISTATSLGVKTAIHLNEDSTVEKVLLSVQHLPHSLEHASGMSDERLVKLRDRGVYWVPTLAAYYSLRSARSNTVWEHAKDTFQRALRLEGLKIACGGDTGVFAHGNNALELKLMVQLGADPKQVLQWATLGGWECVRGLQWEGIKGQARIGRISDLGEDPRITGDNDVPFGVIKKGFAADIIATNRDPNEEFCDAVDSSSITFVMKGGRIFKQDGRALC